MRPMTHTPDITARTTDPIDLALACLAAAEEKAIVATQLRAEGEHSAAGIEREHQRYYLARSRAHAEISKAQSLQRIADAAEREALRR